MKRDRLFTRIEGILTGFILSFSAVACLVTAFSMGTVDLWLLALYCAIGAVVTALLCTRRLDLVLLGLMAVGAGYLWQKGILGQTVESLLYKISRVYHDAYHWPIIRWSYRDVREMELTLAPIIYILGTALSVLTAWTVCKGQSSIVACLPAVLPVAACFVVTDSLPDTVWLLLFLTAVVVLMLTSTTRQQDRAQGRRLALMTVIPVFLAVGILFLAVPRQTYYHKEKAQAISEFFVGKYTLDELLELLAGKLVQPEQKKVDLSTLGARKENQTKVLEVTSRYDSGTLYLRTSSLDRYTGVQWVDSEIELPDLYWPEPATGGAFQINEVVIKTQYAHEMLYLPYYPVSLDISGMTRGIPNAKKLNEYSVTQIHLDPYGAQFGASPSVTPAQRVQSDALCRLSDETKKWAIPLAKQIVGDMQSPYYQALMIAEYVKNSARYDKNTGPMDPEYADFAQWFLEKSETGYCVHFATAGATLLKALGIPARYVTGYMVSAQAGTAVDVTVANAHAWVEYWLPGFGWTMLECTPPDEGQQAQPDTTRPTVPELTQPEMPTLGPDSPSNIPVKPEKAGWERFLYLLLIPVSIAGLWLQRKLRLRHTDRSCRKGSANQQALRRWQAAEELYRRLGTQPPEDLRTLAEKAKFSPYTLTREELTQFDRCILTAVAQLKKKNIFCRLWHQWILALY